MIGKKEKMSFKEIWNAIKILSNEEREKLKKKFESEFLQDDTDTKQIEQSNNDDYENNDISPQNDIQCEDDNTLTEDNKCDNDSLLEIITKVEARVSALERSMQFIIDEEIGVDSDFVNEVNAKMSAAYAKQAKATRF